VISQEGLKMDPKKVKAIKEWPSPRNIFEVRSFHGLSSFYRKFIRNFSGICAPILEIVEKEKQPFRWTEATEKGFKLLKEKITKRSILSLPDFNKIFTVRCDTNWTTVGGVLSQDDKPIAYFNEKLNEPKQKHSTYDKEFYTVIQALKKWRHYLVPKDFVLYSDNHDLQFITKKDKLNQKHAKWVEFMQMKHVKIQF
jgi:hypothetical protein